MHEFDEHFEDCEPKWSDIQKEFWDWLIDEFTNYTSLMDEEYESEQHEVTVDDPITIGEEIVHVLGYFGHDW